MNVKRSLLILLPFYLLAVTVNAQHRSQKYPPLSDQEIIYHIFERSFYDSNGDYHGDLNGIRLKLNYLQQLGVTAILLTPLYESVFYHNYFSGNFNNIDQKYGKMNDYLALVKELHHRGMKIYLDMETQYVTEDHPWWKNGVNNLNSPYSDFILYEDKAHTKPQGIIFNLKGLLGYDSVYRRITTVNLKSPGVLEYNFSLFKYFVDPNNDGKFDDGVDGFRLDHMMDNLDHKPELTGLFAAFWNPLLGRLRKVNHKINIVAEQAEWGSYAIDYLEKGGVDRVFAFRLAFAIRSFDKKQLRAAADSTFLATPAGKQQVVFIENHDMPRFSYGVKSNPGKLRVGAALNLLLGGIPSVYYGQEIGMSGTNAALGATDANDIPNRAAFEWYKSDEGKGMAYWYKQKGPWKKQFNTDKPNDGISLEEEIGDPNSIYNFYRQMIALRKANPVIANGTYKTLLNNNDKVFSFSRFNKEQQMVIAVNLSGDSADVTIVHNDNRQLKALYGPAKPSTNKTSIKLSLSPYGIAVLSN